MPRTAKSKRVLLKIRMLEPKATRPLRSSTPPGKHLSSLRRRPSLLPAKPIPGKTTPISLKTGMVNQLRNISRALRTISLGVSEADEGLIDIIVMSVFVLQQRLVSARQS
jgi:hypothetical protein